MRRGCGGTAPHEETPATKPSSSARAPLHPPYTRLYPAAMRPALPCTLHYRVRCTAVHAGHPPHAPILQPCILRREAVQSDMRMQAAARDEAVQREELLSSQVKATVATRADLEKELEERQSDARRELQQRRRL